MTEPGPFSQYATFVDEWLDAFNKHDLERILSHYQDGVELISPLYLAWTGGMSDRVQGIDALEAYFSGALARFPALSFELLEVADGARGPCIRYRTSLDGRIAMEAFELGDDGRALRVLCHYVGS